GLGLQLTGPFLVSPLLLPDLLFLLPLRFRPEQHLLLLVLAQQRLERVLELLELRAEPLHVPLERLLRLLGTGRFGDQSPRVDVPDLRRSLPRRGHRQGAVARARREGDIQAAPVASALVSCG